MSAFTLDPAGLKFLAAREGFVGHPYWPEGLSGITLDIGYDLGQVDDKTFAEDWQRFLAPGEFRRLLACVGLKGKEAGLVAVTSVIKSIAIPKVAAQEVFEERTVLRYIDLCEATFPGVKDTPANVRTALTSLVFNRGGIPTSKGIPKDGSSTDSDRYDDERGIVNAIAESNYPKVAAYLKQMGQDGVGTLWPGERNPNPGLRKRRLMEADLIEAEWR